MAFSSGSGKGSTFSVLLPLHQISTTRDPNSRADDIKINGPLSGLRILSVDDDLDTRTLVKLILRKNGAVVLTAASAQEALTSVDAFRPNIIISDLSMPAEDGFSLIQKLNASLQPKPPSIALSAFVDKENQNKALAAGFDTFVGKPFQAKQFVELIDSLVKT